MGGRPVLFLSYSGVLGGSERVLLDCATRLGRPALIACPEGPLAAAARTARLPVAALPNRTLRMRGHRVAAVRGLGGLAYDAASLARRVRPEVLVAWGARAVLACVTAPGRVVAVHHDFPSSAPLAAALRAASGRADAVLATSEAVAGAVGGATVLHPGIDLAAWSPLPPAEGPPHALVLGALVPWKRADLALEIAAHLPDVRFTIAGRPLPGDDPAFVAALRARAAELGDRVRLPGHVDPRAALRDAHLLLHCADAEPFGMVLLEAMASGRPAVAPAAGGPAEIIDDPRALYPPGDAAAGAASVRAVLADPGDPRRRAEAFPVEASAARLREVLA